MQSDRISSLQKLIRRAAYGVINRNTTETARYTPEGQFLLNDIVITSKMLAQCKIQSKKYGPIG
jgi:hypothetical protein